MNCKYCNTELVSYTGGGRIFKGYPYESGYACPNCGKEWSDLQISIGGHLPTYEETVTKRSDEMIKDVEKFLQTPRDISGMDLVEQADIITLSFIGYTARPTGISKELLEKCCDAFNNHRGTVEWEIEAVLKVLEEAQCQ